MRKIIPVILLLTTCRLLVTICFAQESLSITTYYPSPYGSYRELTSHRMKIGTTYSGSGIAVGDNNLIVEGAVGIGTASPSYILHVVGTIYSSVDLASGGTKSFVIDHPTKPGMKLVHASAEGPEAAVFYRGEARLVNGEAIVELPDYFEALTRKEDRTVYLTAKGAEPYLLSASEVSEGKFKVYGTKQDGEFYWEAKAVRADVEPLRVEKPSGQQAGQK